MVYVCQMRSNARSIRPLVPATTCNRIAVPVRCMIAVHRLADCCCKLVVLQLLFTITQAVTRLCAAGETCVTPHLKSDSYCLPNTCVPLNSRNAACVFDAPSVQCNANGTTGNCMSYSPRGVCVSEQCTVPASDVEKLAKHKYEYALQKYTCDPGATNATMPWSCCAGADVVCTTSDVDVPTCQKKVCTQLLNETCNADATASTEPAKCCTADSSLYCATTGASSGTCQLTPNATTVGCTRKHGETCRSNSTNSTSCCSSDLHCLKSTTSNFTCQYAKCSSNSVCDAGATALSDPTMCCQLGVCINVECTMPICQLGQGEACDQSATATSNPLACCAPNAGLCIHGICTQSRCQARNNEQCSANATAATSPEYCCSDPRSSCQNNVCSLALCNATFLEPCEYINGHPSNQWTGGGSTCCRPPLDCFYELNPNSSAGKCWEFIPSEAPTPQPTRQPTISPTPDPTALTSSPTSQPTKGDNSDHRNLVVITIVGSCLILISGGTYCCWRNLRYRRLQRELEESLLLYQQQDNILPAPPSRADHSRDTVESNFSMTAAPRAPQLQAAIQSGQTGTGIEDECVAPVPARSQATRRITTSVASTIPRLTSHVEGDFLY